MNHSTESCWTLVLPESGFAFDVGSLYDRFDELTDQRAARGKRYPLAVLLLLMVLAKLAGEDQPHGIAEWVRMRASELIELLPLTRASLPCANTYRAAASRAVQPAELQQVVSAFLQSQPQAGQCVLICIDGKTMRGTLCPSNPSGVHLLAAYLPAEGLVLVQVQVAAKSNEITAAPQVLKSLDLRGKIVMGDALHTQRALSVHIVAAGGDYIWLAKDNQPALRADIERVFLPEVCGSGSSSQPIDFQSSRQADKAHGRIEVRTLTASTLLEKYSAWPGLKQVFKLEREVQTRANPSPRSEVVYGLTSLPPTAASPARLLELTRAYWGIENGLHYRRDVTLREDATRMQNANAAQVWATLNNLLIGLLPRLPFDDLPQARRYFSAHPEDALHLLTTRTL
jgi:predicted transposase YbfD/YdcC